jgi:hypothetical protein
MAVNVPEWLSKRGGVLKPASDGKTWYVRLTPMFQYAVASRPVGDKFGCAIKNTNSGQPVPTTCNAPGPDEAVAAGLEELRKFLGW